MIMMADSEVNWAAMPLTGVFDTADGALVLVGAFKENPLRSICAALGIDDMSIDPRFCNLAQQFKHKCELQSRLCECFRANTRGYWLARLEAEDLLCAPVLDLRETLRDPQTAHNGMLLKGSDEGQPLQLVGSPIGLSNAPVAIRSTPPRLGQHTAEILELAQRCEVTEAI